MKTFVEDKKKSLNENIKSVLESELSRSAKARTLVEVLGLTKIEASYFMQSVPVTPRVPRAIRKFLYKFGVEIEMLCNRQKVESGLTRDGLAYNWAGCYYHTNGNSQFEFKRDGSICTNADTEIGNYGIECVSPVLSSEGGLNAIKGICKVLEESGAQVNKSTGLHIHLSTEGMNDEWFIRVFKNYQRLESIIDRFMAPSRRNNSFCKSISRFDYDACQTIDDVKRVMGDSEHIARYHKVNPCAWASHRTIEFRQHQGTVNYEKISMWLAFVSKLVEFSKTRLIENVTCVEEIPFLNADEKVFFKARTSRFAGL